MKLISRALILSKTPTNTITELCLLNKDNRLACAIIDEYSDFRLITDITVELKHRGTGIGTQLINKILKESDKKCKKTVLFPASFGDENYQKRLIEFYKRFGFSLNTKDPYDFEMIRQPKCRSR